MKIDPVIPAIVTESAAEAASLRSDEMKWWLMDGKVFEPLTKVAPNPDCERGPDGKYAHGGEFLRKGSR